MDFTMNIGNMLSALLDLQVNIFATLTILKERYASDIANGDDGRCDKIIDEMNEMEASLRLNLREYLYANYADLPPDIGKLINPKRKD